MLSFTSNDPDNDKAIAHGFDNEECMGEPKFTVYFKPEYYADPEISSSEPKALLRTEQFRIQEEFSMSTREYEILVDLVSREEPVPEDSGRGFKRAYLAIQKVMHHKLKNELEFGPDEKVFLKPVYDSTKPRTNHICTLFASSGAGKSWKVNDLLMRNPCVLNNICPGIFLFSSVGDNDPSYKPIKDFYQFKFFWKDPRDLDPEDTQIRTYEERSILIFDDINSISDRRVREKVIHFRETCLEIARHRSLGIISTEHLFHNRAKTQKLRNSSAYLCLYPRNSPKPIDDVLENNFNLNRFERNSLIKKCKREGRANFIHVDYPGYLVNTKRVHLF